MTIVGVIQNLGSKDRLSESLDNWGESSVFASHKQIIQICEEIPLIRCTQI